MTLVPLTTSAEERLERRSRKPTPPRGSAVTPDPERPDLRMRVETEAGVLVIYDAPAPPLPDEEPQCSGFLVYWQPVDEETVYVFGSVVHDDAQLGETLGILQTDFEVDLDALVEADARLAPAVTLLTLRDQSLGRQPEDTTPSPSQGEGRGEGGGEGKTVADTEEPLRTPDAAIVWQFASLERVVEIMGFDPADLDEPADGGVALLGPPCDASVPPPENCGSPRALATEALRLVTACGGGGGGGGGPEPPCVCCIPVVASDAEGPVSSRDGTGTVASCCYCNDGDPCTYDACSNGNCTYPPGNNGVSCLDDGNPCTRDVCASGTCTHPSGNNGASCLDDGDPCTRDVCGGGACTHPSGNNGAVCADDGNPCTADVCDMGACTHPPISGPTCEDDGVPCTHDLCNNGACTHPPKTGGECTDDGDKCTDDVCANGTCTHPAKVCVPHTPCGVAFCHACVGCMEQSCCDDGNPCTTEACSGSGNCCGFEDACRWSCQQTSTNPTDTCNPQGCDTVLDLSNVPRVIPLNDDDDNGNGIPDYQESGSVSGEDGRFNVPLSVNWSCAPFPGCTHELSTYSASIYSEAPQWGWPSLRFFTTSSGNTPAELLPWPGPTTVWLEGHGITDACGVRAGVWIKCPTSYSCFEDAAPRIIVAKVVKLEWQLHATSASADSCNPADNPGMSLCPNNGGTRIFPDKLSPLDSTPALRRQVDLVATIEPAVANVMVWFRGYDVDDPFDQLHGPQGANDVANANLVDPNGAGGGDNRGGGGMGTVAGVTDKNGQARVTMNVSMQPGDNYRAAATLQGGTTLTSPQVEGMANDLSVRLVNGKYYNNGGFSGYKCPVVWSPMLTVWRKLHVEFDTMLSEPTTGSGREPDWQGVYVTGATPNASTTTLQLGLTIQGANPHQYEGGRIAFDPPGPVYSVYDHTDDTVEIRGVLSPSEIAAITEHWATIKDDDPDGSLLPKFYTISSFIRSAYEDAYVDIVDLGAQYNTRRTLAFDLYVTQAQMVTGIGWNDSKDLYSASDFWVSLAVAGYQAGGNLAEAGNRDNDPDPQVDNATYPNPPYWTGGGYAETIQEGWTTGNFGDWDSIVFRAAIADFPQWANYEDQVIAHEIGHSGGNVGTEAEHHAEGCLMRLDPLPTDTGFCGSTLRRFREAQKW